MAHEYRGRAGATSAHAQGTDSAIGPGKSTLTERLPVQRKASGSSPPFAAATPLVTPAAVADDPFGLHLAASSAPVQRRADRPLDAAPPSADGGGAALPDPVRTKMEAAFSRDFSAVRVHEGPQAAAVGAVAYTQGTDVHFRPGQYDPSSRGGQELLGHELAHVVQQADGRVAATRQAKGVALNDDPALEREADDWGARAAAGEVGILGSGAGTIPGGSPGPLQAKGAVIQRAVGFEMEVASWTSTKDKGARLDKAEKIVKGDGFNLEADEVLSGKESDIEFVVHPPISERKRAEAVFDAIYDLTQDMAKAGQSSEDGTFNAEQVGSDRKDVTLRSSKDFSASMQVTVAVPLEKIPALFGKMGSGKAIDFEVDMSMPNQFVERNKKAFASLPKELGGPSPQLRGLAVLIVDYLRHGHRGGFEQFPKGLYPVMARTSFKKMFSMIPEAEYFAENPDRWASMMLELAGLSSLGDGRVLGPTFAGMEEGKLLRLATTRNEWLMAMPEKDLLSGGHDHRFDGMGAIGGGTDKLVTDKSEKSTEDSKDEGGDSKLEGGKLENVIEEGSEELSSILVKYILEEKGRIKDEIKTIEELLEKDERMEISLSGTSKGKDSEDKDGPPSQEAAVFEMRRFARPGPPSAWKAAALSVFDEVDKTNDRHKYEAQVPEKNKDDDDEKKEKPRKAPFEDVTNRPKEALEKPEKKKKGPSIFSFLANKFSFKPKGYDKLDEDSEGKL